jgi:hypothetical protein|tara:strand:- start:253 stop:618 length:366 start_codon:yes stop_codon:yes gene_type:complete
MITIINELYYKAMQTEGMKNRGKHVLEVGVDDYMHLMHYREFVNSIANNHPEPIGKHLYFRSAFSIKLIQKPKVRSSDKCVDNSIETKSHQHQWYHASIHVERTNGRMVYYDWDGNDERLV